MSEVMTAVAMVSPLAVQVHRSSRVPRAAPGRITHCRDSRLISSLRPCCRQTRSGSWLQHRPSSLKPFEYQSTLEHRIRILRWSMRSAVLLATFTITIATLVIASMDGGFAADVGCHQRYLASGRPFPVERARKLWPSGRTPTSSTCSIAYIKGPITSGDFEKFVSFYRAQHPFVSTVLLQSPGGSVSEAMKIGRLLRRYLVEAKAPERINGHNVLMVSARNLCAGPDCICASACALVWFGAPDRQGRVGLHRPYRKDLEFGSLSADAAKKQYQHALRDVTSYLTEMGAPSIVVEAMSSTSSADVRWVDDGVLWGNIPMARDAAFDEWLRSNCPTLGVDEYRALLALQVAGQERNLSPQERDYLEQLSSKDFRASACEHQVVSRNRDALPPP